MAARRTVGVATTKTVRRRRPRRTVLPRKLLLDTHTFLWFVTGSAHLSATARHAIEDGSNIVFVSAASVWEIAIKRALGRLPDTARFLPSLARYLRHRGFTELPVTADHAERAGDLPLYHHDPFDRMLIAQASAEHLALVSNERLFDEYGVPRVW